MRVPPPRLARAMARQVRACLSELPDAPSGVRNEMLSIASCLRFLSAELEHGPDCSAACDAAANRLQTQLRSEGLDLPVDVPAILKEISSPAFEGGKGDLVFGWLVEYLQSCNQAELGMYRQGVQARGGKA